MRSMLRGYPGLPIFTTRLLLHRSKQTRKASKMLTNTFSSLFSIAVLAIGLANAAVTPTKYSAELYKSADVPEYRLANNPAHPDANCQAFLDAGMKSGLYLENAMDYHCTGVLAERDAILPAVPIYLQWKHLCMDSQPRNPVLKVHLSKAITRVENGVNWGKEKQCYRKAREECTIMAQYKDAVVEWCTSHEGGYENRYANGFWCPTMASLALRMVRECPQVKLKGKAATSAKTLVEARSWGKTIYGELVVRKA
ncbi:hypothetical protein BJ508DRAFT_361544 [Ascobolus immersus RN42]|uniref:Uncharacterized protein n=1 Tax=Ascobolus immersus RN42 TaxID=1160509 RepID=A0A3N4I8Y7_ASCIM|nr:hypothetical protein BJ508DRAFT_361544 [Ascobolus immersus RN42]